MGGIRIIDTEDEIENEYVERFANSSIEELISSFNGDQPSKGWVGARGRFLAALRQAFLDSGVDCSNFISDNGMSLAHQIELKDKVIYQLKDV